VSIAPSGSIAHLSVSGIKFLKVSHIRFGS
jgi:hypothetical protein